MKYVISFEFIWWMQCLSSWLINYSSVCCALQSLLAALGSVQFVSNLAFAYFVLNKMVTVKYVKFELRLLFQFCSITNTVLNIVFLWLNHWPSNRVLVATAFIVLGNIFLVAFGNHQSPGIQHLAYSLNYWVQGFLWKQS